MWIVFIVTLLFPALVFGQSVDELLREADATLSGKKTTNTQSGTGTSNGKVASPKNSKAAQVAPIPAEDAGRQETAAPAESQTTFNPTEAAQILKADLKAIKDEQTQRDPRVDFSLLGGSLTFAPSFSLYKDDDSFRLEKSAHWTGATVETSAGWTLVRFGQFGLVGTTAGSLGFYSGEGLVNRSGIQSRVYEMRFMTLPMELGAGLGIAWLDNLSLGVRFGPSINVLNQKGLGTQDTLSGVFGGDLLVTSLKARLTSGLSLRADYRRQGLLNTALVSQAMIFGISYNLH